MAPWRLDLLDANSLADGAGEYVPDRKTAALLAFLTLHGPASRRLLAGLLWPETDEPRARNSLARVLSRLRRATHPAIVTGDEIVRLGDDVHSDLLALRDALERREYPLAVELAGELLPHFDYDDLPDFNEWVSSERAAFECLAANALTGRIRQFEADGRFPDAVPLARRLVKLDPLREASWRLLMRLHTRNGDRAAAAAVLVECREVLQRELGLEPSAETIAAASDEASLSPTTRSAMVTAPLRSSPSTASKQDPLVGRDEELAAMEAAWRRGHAILVIGPAGSGKTRLVEEFARSRAPVLCTGGMPGDPALPYSSLSRVFRRIMRARPDLRLEPWVEEELARLLPERGAADPPGSDLRFEAALAWLYDAFLGRDGVVLADDLHHYDAASFEAASRIVNQRPAEGLPARTVCACRSDELPASYRSLVDDLHRHGALTVVHLGGLDEEATTALAVQVGGEAVRHLGTRLHTFTGGIPLFIVETVELLKQQADGLSEHPSCLPAGPRSVSTVHAGLARLPLETLRLLQTASILKVGCDLEALATALQRSSVELWTPWRQLENTGYLHNGQLSSGLMAIAVEATVPEPVRMSLLRQREGSVPLRAGPAHGL